MLSGNLLGKIDTSEDLEVLAMALECMYRAQNDGDIFNIAANV